jgi:UDP-2-acetamido-3-amino-2,3-dideoxy-glucuronate N-acetyltransferase
MPSRDSIGGSRRSEPRAAVRIHPTAIVEPGVELGAGTAVWDGVHIRRNARIGRDCIVGEKTYIAYDVVIGDRVKINAAAYLCAGVIVEDGCMISAHVVFTNDRFPRACDPDLAALQTSDPTEETLPTLVRRGVTIGANATIGPGLEIGEFAMVGMGAVVTRSVPPHALVHGAPARVTGHVCACGHRLRAGGPGPGGGLRCERCGRVYHLEPHGLLAA